MKIKIKPKIRTANNAVADNLLQAAERQIGESFLLHLCRWEWPFRRDSRSEEWPSTVRAIVSQLFFPQSVASTQNLHPSHG